VFAFASMGNMLIAGAMGGLGDYNLKLSYTIPIFCALIILALTFHLASLKRSGKVEVSPR